MRKKISASYILLILVLTVTFALILSRGLNEMMTLQLEERFISEAKIVRQLFEEAHLGKDGIDYQDFALKIHREIETRITLIAEDGSVLADTSESPERMNNHLNRQEVSEAIRTGDVAVSIRFSNTVNSDFLYVAIPTQLPSGLYVIRVSKQLVELEALNRRIFSLSAYALVGAAILAIVLSLWVSKKITKPIDALTLAVNQISEGEFGKKIYIKANDQIGELADAFNKMSQNLDVSLSELKQRNSELEAILNSIANGIIAVDQNKNIILINRFSFEILELPSDYVAQHESMYKIIRNEEIVAMVNSAMEQGEAQIKELAYVHLEKVLRINVNPIFTSDRKIIGGIIVIQDVTQIRKLEQMRSDFVSNVSHELKTPLTSIKGFVDTLKNGAIHNPDTAMRFLDIIDIESDRLYRLINDILLLSEIESMDRDVDQQVVDVQSVVEEVLDMLDQKAAEKGLSLTSDFDKRMVVNANLDRVKQMFINLIDNAIKYTEKGVVTVKGAEIGDWVNIKVIDSGIGFDEVHKERLFERFYRVDKGRSRGQGGTGLGLSIVKHIVLLYKGKINVESTPGVGTVFDIVLPKGRINGQKN